MTTARHQPMVPRKYRYCARMMTRAEAIEIRKAHLEGRPVLALELQEACRVLSKQREPIRFKLPILTAFQREQMNACLLWNLGRALGRIEAAAGRERQAA